MNGIGQTLRKWFSRAAEPALEQAAEAAPAPLENDPLGDFDLAPNDPLVAYFQHSPSVALVDKIEVDSPALEQLKRSGITLIVPLVSQGELIGLINLGPRLSEQDYSSDDISLLNNLAAQATPAVRVAQLVRQQQIEAQERERMEQELQVARLIQQTLLPKELPAPQGWEIQAYYQPARAVGGDFYDFINLPGDRLGIFVGDVTDKGVPAALVMATTRRILRFAAETLDSPGKVLEQANNLLCADIPPNMFVTCLYAILDLHNGTIRFANAGHNPPYTCGRGQVTELRATGMPLGLMPEMRYEEKEAVLGYDECVLFYSDGLTEAHNPHNEIFGFERVQQLMNHNTSGGHFIEDVLASLSAFTGPEWEQEDDVSFVTLYRIDRMAGPQEDEQQVLASFELASQAGNERIAMEKAAAIALNWGLPESRIERLKTAVSEAAMNAIEHGNRFQADLPVHIDIRANQDSLSIVISDHGGGASIPKSSEPDLEAKLAGMQSPRGWGLFLIEKMVDELKVSSDDTHHRLELVFQRTGGNS